MREKHETSWPHFAGAVWPRRAVIGLWVVIFVGGGSVLALKWDGLMARLARPPLAAGASLAVPR